MGRFIAVITLTVLFLFSQAGIVLAGSQIIINKTTNRLHFLRDGRVVQSFPVATGKHPSYTPEGHFYVVAKLINPYYSKLGIPGGSPNNPLGTRWLGLSIGGGGVYGIHGTNNPASIGTYASAGCIRMHNKDVIWLYDHTPLGTPVTITRSSAPAPPAPKPKPKPVTVVAQGQTVTIQTPATSGDDLPLLPLRPVFELLGYGVAWDGITSTVHLRKGGESIAVNCATGLVNTGNTAFEERKVKIVNGSAHGPISLWHGVLPAWEVLWDSQARTITFIRQTGTDPPPGPVPTLPGIPASLPGD